MVLENLNFAGLGAQMGGSALLGGVIGFAAKKVAKIIAVIVGLELVILKFLESRGVLQVDWSALTNATDGGGQTIRRGGQTLVEAFVSSAGIGASFAAGFAIGFKRA